MNKAILFNFLVDKESKQIKIERAFNAEPALVWQAWTKAEILDQWWAPKPWKTRTKSMDFSVGGHWVYAMISPENEEHFGRVDYMSISPEKAFTAYDGFCDSEGNLNKELPRNKWQNEFLPEDHSTLVRMVLTFNSLEDLETIIQMGFKEGFESALNNLDEWLKTQTR